MYNESSTLPRGVCVFVFSIDGRIDFITGTRGDAGGEPEKLPENDRWWPGCFRSEGGGPCWRGGGLP